MTMTALKVAMVVSAGLFAGSVGAIAWERLPAWRVADIATFKSDFGHTIRRVDRLQPILLVASIASGIAFAVRDTGMPRVVAAVAAVCLIAVLMGSAGVLVPLQRRLIDPDSGLSVAEVERGRKRWLRGHLLRSTIAIVAFLLLTTAAVA